MKLLYLFIFLGFIFSGCVKNNPDPSWLEVNKWDLQINSSSVMYTGELTENITDAWVFVDDQIIGVFEVPFKIPILKSGSVNIKIYPTVKNNGISATKKIYPFLEVYEINTELVQNQTLTLNPTTRYYSNTNFWVEDFEDAGVKIQDDPNTVAHLETGNDPLILEYGNNYGHVSLTSPESFWIAKTNGQLNLPKNGKDVYLEIDYYNTNSVTTGLMAAAATGNVGNTNVQLNKQDPSSIKWKKIYIELTEITSHSQSAQYFEVTFEALFDAIGSQGDIYIDNIKVVHL